MSPKLKIYIDHLEIEHSIERMMILLIRAKDIAGQAIHIKIGETYLSGKGEPFGIRSDMSRPYAIFARHIIQALAEETDFDVKVNAPGNSEFWKIAKSSDDAVLLEALKP
jgi:hypothetical protein